MRVLLRLTLVVLVVYSCQLARCDDGENPEEGAEEPRISEELVDKKDGVRSGGRRTTTQASANATRDSQLLSVLAARRRQLLNGRLATHINTLASLAHKNKGNTTFAQLEVRDSNSSIVKRITFDNGSNEAAPSLKIVTTDGTREIRQDVKPHEIRHLFIPKVYQETRSRAGFLNNRRKEVVVTKVSNTSQEVVTENAAVYIPPEKLEGLDKEIELDPEEEFQVDESNHGLYLLNYSDTENVTISNEFNKTLNTNETKENSVLKPEGVATRINTPVEISTTEIKNKTTQPTNIAIANKTDDQNNLPKVDTEKDKDNNTLFMSDEIYNHFRPLETELAIEDMAPFIYFGQKIGGQSIGDNLTNSPSLSASTKSVNFIIAPPERRKFNSRYSATEKNKNSSVDEEEINEDMDVSVVKNIIEKNKVRNSVKGTAPGRHVGLVNAYRKYTTVPTSKPPNIAQLNVTDAIISVTPSILDKNKNGSRTNTTVLKEFLTKIDNTTANNDSIADNSNVNRNIQNKTSNAAPRNHTRTYHNLRRRPARVTTSASTENAPLAPAVNATTEKAATLVYTAVVTSVSITSSMKGQNKTDVNGTDIGVKEDSEIKGDLKVNDKENSTSPKAITLEDIEATASSVSPTIRPYKHRIRIRTTTTENPSTPLHRADLPVASELSAREIELRNEATQLKISERLASLYGKPEIDNTPSNSTIKPKNILRRRRPTTTSTTPSTTALPTTFITERPIPISRRPLTTPSTLPTTVSTVPPTTLSTTEEIETTENTFRPFIVTSRTSSESSSKPFVPQTTNINPEPNTTKFNTTWNNREEGLADEEVVIEAEKAYTTSYVLAGLGFLPVAAIVAFVLRSIFNKRTKEIDTEYEGYFEDSDIKKETPIIPVARPPIPPPSKPDQKWEFPRNKLRLQTLLGQGNFGQVWKAQADDLTGHDGLTRLVAVKSIKETASQKEKQELLHEIYIMQKIGTHPNVVTLLACCTEQEPYLLIMEYVMCGKLLTYLRERRSRPDRFSGSGALTSRDLTVFSYCVARGMDYIASKGIVHRDLAARNVLVDHNKLCKIADFGMSREVAGGEERAKQRHALPVRWMAPEALLYNVYNHETDVWAYGILLWEIVTLVTHKLCKIADFGMSREVAGGEERAKQRHALPVRWMAPEALLYNVYNHETDVWAYGILLWEIVTLGSTPYAAMTGREVLAAVTEGYRLERPPHCKPQLYRAMHSCWHADPTQRPSFASLKSQLADLLDNEPAEGNYVDLESFYQESSVYSDPSAIIHDEEGLSAEYDRERRVFRELAPGPKKYDNRGFNFRDEDLRNKFGSGTPRMGGFGIRDVPFNGDFNERQFTRDEKTFNERNFGESNFNSNFNEQNFSERKDGKLSTSSFHRERERENPLVSRNSFSGFPRLSSRDTHFQLMPDGRNKRVSEFECDI